MKILMLPIALVVLLLAGCATGPSLSTTERNVAYAEYISTNSLEKLKKINSFRFQGWQSLSNEYLILSTSVRKKYLVEVNGFCPDLDFANAIRINQSMSGSLVAKFDSISVVSNDANSKYLKCYIKSIHQLTKDQAKEMATIGRASEKKENVKGQDSDAKSDEDAKKAS